MRQTEATDAPRQTKIKVAKDGGFVIPPVFCDALGIKAGDEIVMSWKDDELCITKKLPTERAERSPRRRARR